MLKDERSRQRSIIDAQVLLEITVQAIVTKNQDVELGSLQAEIDILNRALEVKAEELGAHGDVQSGLLYELAQQREECRRLALELSARSGIIMLWQFIVCDECLELVEDQRQELSELRAHSAALQEDREALTNRAASLSADMDNHIERNASLQQVCRRCCA